MRIATKFARLFWKKYRWTIEDKEDLRKAGIAISDIGMAYGDIRLCRPPQRGDILGIDKYKDDEGKEWWFDGRVEEVIIHSNGVTVKLKLLWIRER